MKSLTKKAYLGILLGLFVATIVLGIATSAKGAELVSIEREIQKLEDENRKLTTTLVSESSLTELTQETSSFGLIPASSVVYITKEEAIAYAK